MSQWCHHLVHLSSNNVCAISQASPTEKAKGDRDKEPKLPSVTEMEKKHWEKPGSVGPVLLWPEKTSKAWFNSRLQHRSDCAEVLSGSYVLVLMLFDMVSTDIQGCRDFLSVLIHHLIWIRTGCGCNGDLGIKMESNISIDAILLTM